MTGHRDAVLEGVLSCRQISPQDGVVADTEEGHDAVPRLVVEPHLRRQRRSLVLRACERLCGHSGRHVGLWTDEKKDVSKGMRCSWRQNRLSLSQRLPHFFLLLLSLNLCPLKEVFCFLLYFGGVSKITSQEGSKELLCRTKTGPNLSAGCTEKQRALILRRPPGSF